MASQQVLFAETILAMKKARKRKAYESDSDTEIDHHGNRGNKLKKRARFVHQGQLAPPSGPEVYREIVTHAGYQRVVISRNPMLIDDEGYEIDSDDDDQHIQDVAYRTAEFNPYANVRLETILAPLTSVTGLPTHPTLSRPYTSKTLSELTKQSCDIMHKENQALWKVKHLQTKLVGDHVWAPCEMMIGPNDIELYRDDYAERSGPGKGSSESDARMPQSGLAGQGDNAETQASMNGDGDQHSDEKRELISQATENADISMTDDGHPVASEVNATRDEALIGEQSERNGKNKKQGSSDESRSREALETELQRQNGSSILGGTGNRAMSNSYQDPVVNGSMAFAKAQEASHNRKGPQPEGCGAESVTAGSVGEPPIHPFFLAPASARPDRDVGIPEAEAEDMRRLLQLYVHKQEEVCRGAKRLYEGLLRADRMRKTVLQWSKHEAHVGPNRDMSDGEDWYDKEEWGLEEDLKKGQDEEEEDTQQTTKKTRARR